MNALADENLDSFAGTIREAIVRTKVADMTLSRATATALDLESALLQWNVFEVFEGADAESKAIYNRVRIIPKKLSAYPIIQMIENQMN